MNAWFSLSLDCLVVWSQFLHSYNSGTLAHEMVSPTVGWIFPHHLMKTVLQRSDQRPTRCSNPSLRLSSQVFPACSKLTKLTIPSLQQPGPPLSSCVHICGWTSHLLVLSPAQAWVPMREYVTRPSSFQSSWVQFLIIWFWLLDKEGLILFWALFLVSCCCLWEIKEEHMPQLNHSDTYKQLTCAALSAP